MSDERATKVHCADEFFFTPTRDSTRYSALAHSRNYGLPALPRAFFARFPANLHPTQIPPRLPSGVPSKPVLQISVSHVHA